MKRRPILFLVAVALVSLLIWSCDKTDDGGPTGLTSGGVPTADPGVAAPGGTFLADGEDETTVSVLVTDTSARPLVGVPIQLTTTRGSLSDAFVVTDFDGKASSTLTSDASGVDVFATVCASVPDAVDSTSLRLFKQDDRDRITIPTEPTEIRLAAAKSGDAGDALAEANRTGCADVPMIGVRVSVAASTARIPADGERSASVSAIVRETRSGIPIATKRVRFSTTSGRIEGELVTDSNGEAQVELVSATTPGTARVVGFLAPGISDTVVVEFAPILFSVTSVVENLPANGIVSAAIVATVLSEQRNPLPGLAVEFSTTLGRITSPVVTDASGRAIASLTGEGTGGQAVVIARFANAATDTVTVEMDETFQPASVVVSIAPATLVADGLSQAQVSATVLDSVGGPVPDGTRVRFEIVSGGGTLLAISETSGGIAHTTLTSGTTAGTVTVRATARGVSATGTATYTVGLASSITLAVSPTSLVGNGIETATVTATVRDGNGNLVGAGVPVSFASDRGTISPSVVTDAAGRAVAVYTTDLGAGVVQINVSSGTSQASTTLTQTSGAAAQIVLANQPPISIGIRGTGEQESATMVFRVLSADGVPIDLANQVTVQFVLTAKTNNGAGSGEFLQPTSDVTDENGFVRTTLNAGTMPGVTKTIARIASPSIESGVVPVSIDQDLPVVKNLTVASALLNIEGLCYYNLRLPITALVFDQFHNPVPEGTVVYFTANYCGIQAADTTDAHGAATVDFIVGNELPPNGFVDIIAQTADTNGVQIRDTTVVLLSGCARLDNLMPTSFDISNGNCQQFSFNLWDGLHHPLTAGTRIQITTTAGVLSGDIDFIMPDTQSGPTFFEFSLCDQDPMELNPPVEATITIRITSKNNNITTTINGRID